MGRFLEQDPMGFGGGDTNLYRYAFDNPVGLFDPIGTCVIFQGTPEEQNYLKILYNIYLTTTSGQAAAPILNSPTWNFVIQLGDTKGGTYYTYNGSFVEFPSQTGASVNPNGSVSIIPLNAPPIAISNGVEYPVDPVAALSHELGHAIDSSANEIGVVQTYENPTRQQLGLPSRTSY